MVVTRYIYRAGTREVEMRRPPIPYRFRAARKAEAPEIDEATLKGFKRDLKIGYGRLHREQNLVEREICLAEPVQRDRVLGPHALRDRGTIKEYPDVFQQSFNATLLLSLLTFLTYGRILYKGPPGFGKTTTAEKWGEKIYGLDLDWIQAATIYGNDKLTEEMVIARFDIGRLLKGEEVTQERLFALLPFRIIDELNRIPSHILSIFYQLVDRTLHVYGNDHLEIPPGALFATINERAQDTKASGNFPIPRPFYDRFDVSVVVSGLNPLGFHALLARPLLEGAKVDGKRLRETRKRRITLEDIQRHPELWLAKQKLERAQEEISQVRFPGFIPDPKNKKPKDKKDEIFPGRLDINDGLLTAQTEYFLAQIFYCIKMAEGRSPFWGNKAYRQKLPLRKVCEEDPFCAGKGRLCRITDVQQTSMRALQSIIKYSSALAWYLPDDVINGKDLRVSEVIVRELLPFLMVHRLYLEGTEEDNKPEFEKHETVAKLWADAQTAFEQKKDLIKRYYELRKSLEDDIRDSGKIDLTGKDRVDRVSKLLQDVDAEMKEDPARIPMVITIQDLVGTYGYVRRE